MPNFRFHYLSGEPRLQGGVSTYVTKGGNPEEIIGPSPRRRSIAFFIDNQVGGVVGVRPGSFVVTDASFAIGGAGQLIVFRIEDWGSLVQGPWFVRAAAGGASIGIFECLEADYDEESGREGDE